MQQIDPKKLVESAEKASKLLKSMSHPSRLMVLCYLMNGEHPVSALNEAIPLSQSALSQHLAGLRQAGLVDTRRESQTIHYRLNSKAVSGILEALYRIYCDPNTEE
ncbi:MAG: metalloregulator ArsR/SmtB family transcription factor [Desulfosarcina sp.]|jgi:DNA-binding transcriptional ArsR family regulator